MAILRVSVDDEHEEALRNVLNQLPYIKAIEKESESQTDSTLERIKQIQARLGNKELFKDIEDPSEWQRQIRSEWERDFDR
ncbi:hypothetical protein [Mucilaginibacter jinjuensis]|uniref:Addiction module component n=1 Tax=Mucilaginibacter jinjuensis TaxID=1176721 RepID=A0ABY7TBJ4_9SPHI|nr:hypothetical protein [Mucilaginibacter jinjuensis]WCT13554.1 hypothetical protein PQO05_06340 [Mucilaginibacter jinjuensis]